MSGSRKRGVPADRIDPAQQQQSQQQQQYHVESRQTQQQYQQAYTAHTQHQDSSSATSTSRPTASFSAQYPQLPQQSAYSIVNPDHVQQPGSVSQITTSAWSPRSTQMATFVPPLQQPGASTAYAAQYSAQAYEPRASHGGSFVSRDYARTLPQSQQYYGTHEGLPSIQQAYVSRIQIKKAKLT